MTSTKGQHDDQRFEELLLRAEEMLAAGDTDLAACVPKGLDPPLAARLERAVKCLQRLHDASTFRQRTGDDTPLDQREMPRWQLPQANSSLWLDRFEIEREIGQGGMGIVYSARDRTLNRQVALKVPRPEVITSPEVRLRFLREAQATARLQHPAIATVYDAGEAGPICWIACELCNGTSLAEWSASQDLAIDARDAASLVATLAAGVEHAHQRGVLHRDLKPGNVMLVPADESPLEISRERLSSLAPKLTDFGLAKIVDDEGDMTRTGALVGTPSFMAPEQADTQHAEVDTRTDVYGLGAVLYKLLTAQAPFQASNAAEAFRQVLTEEPVPPRRLRRELPADLEAICLKCLEKEPRRRYHSAAAMAEDLNRFLDNEPTLARPVGMAARGLKWARRHPAVASLLTLLVVAVAVIIGGGAWQIHNLNVRAEQEQRDRYITDLKLSAQYWEDDKLSLMQETLARYIPEEGRPDLRDAAWHYLWQRCETQLTTYRGHESDVAAVAYAPDGRTLATGGHDGTVRLFDTQSGETLHVLRGHVGEVNCVGFTPDGKLLASGADEGKVILWNPATGAQVDAFHGHEDNVLCLAITSDGKHLASGGIDRRICIWDLTERKLVHEYLAHGDWVRSLDFSPDTKLLASGSDDRWVKLWDWRTKKQIHRYRIHKEWVTGVKFHPSGAMLASCSKDHSVRIYDIESKAQLGDALFVEDWIRSVDYSPDGRFLAAAGNGHLVHVWRVTSDVVGEPQLVRSFRGHTDKTWALCFSPDGQTLATASGDGTAKQWRVQDDRYADEVWRMPNGVHYLDISPDGSRLVIADSERIVLWDTGRSEAIGVHDRIDQLGDCCFSGDGQWLAVCGPRLGLRLLSATGRPEVRIIDSRPDNIRNLAFHPTRDLLAACRKDGDLLFYDLASGQQRLVTLSEHTEASIGTVKFSPDGRYLAAYNSNTAELYLYDVERDELKHTFTECDGDPVFSADGGMLAYNADDRSIRVWNVPDLEESRIIRGQNEHTSTLAFSPDGSLIASFAYNGPIHLWSIELGDQLFEIPRPATCDSNEMVFSPDGSSLYVAGARRYLASETGVPKVRQTLVYRYYLDSPRARSPQGFVDAPLLSQANVLTINGNEMTASEFVRLRAVVDQPEEASSWFLDIDPSIPMIYNRSSYYRSFNLRLSQGSGAIWKLTTTESGAHLQYVAPSPAGEQAAYDGWYLAFVPISHQILPGRGARLAHPLYLIDREAPPWTVSRDGDVCQIAFFASLQRRDHLEREGWTLAVDPTRIVDKDADEWTADAIVLSESKRDRWIIEAANASDQSR